ncbi:MAG: hypothetical protein MJZ81_07460 [Bacteroidales bacterium]|nr:hypothetical protein [Bacteroidales bacterium]
MIKPATLWGLMKSCDDSKWLGDICRALGGQDVELDFGQRQMVNSIRQDSDWLDEAMEIQREKWRMKKRGQRGTFETCPPSKGTGEMSSVPDCPPPSFLPSILPSIQLSKESEREGAPLARQDVPDLKTVVATATSSMGVSKEYAEWWYDEMQARDWTKVNGGQISNTNWRPVLMSWWNRAKDSGEAQRVQNERKQAQALSPKNLNDSDWILCGERCALFKAGRCAGGCIMPPQLRPVPCPPEECHSFRPKPKEAS